MARFLIVGRGARARALAREVSRGGHVLGVVERGDRLGELTRALEHVTIVCWIEPEISPERFLLAAVDSPMRGFVYCAGDWEQLVLETAARNSIPTAALEADPADLPSWLVQARAAIDRLLDGRYAGTYT